MWKSFVCVWQNCVCDRVRERIVCEKEEEEEAARAEYRTQKQQTQRCREQPAGIQHMSMCFSLFVV